MNRKLFVLLAVTILAASLPAESKMRGPSTSEERARALNYVQSLEQNPLAKDSLDKRMWLTEWLVQVPDFTVNTCCKELDSLDKVNETYSNQLRMQVLYSQAAFMLQHPRVKSDAEIQAAGPGRSAPRLSRHPALRPHGAVSRPRQPALAGEAGQADAVR